MVNCARDDTHAPMLLHRFAPALIALLIAACSSTPYREAPRGGASSGGDIGTAIPVEPNTISTTGPGSIHRRTSIRSRMPCRAWKRCIVRRTGPTRCSGASTFPRRRFKPYQERGIASWYGRKFHGQKTSIGETYDMYAMTAAHPTLPLPSYARVTSVASGKSVVVRVNDRGPFLHGRIIDLSYAAAHRLGIAQNGQRRSRRAGDPAGRRVAIAAGQPAAADAGGCGAGDRDTARPTPASAPAADPDAPPIAPVAGGYSVQLGAFANFANAQAFLAHVQNQLVTAQVEAKIRQAGGLYRVYIGPYPARSEAERVGERITQAFGFATTVAAALSAPDIPIATSSL